jgi:hypothetical protein
VSFDVRRYSSDDQAAWDAFAAASRSGYFLFQRRYMEYHADRFADQSLLAYDGARLAALLPANREGDTLVSHGGLTFGGFLTDRSMSTRRMLELFSTVRAYLREEGIASWIYKVVPHVYHRIPAEEDLYALYREGAQLIRRDASAAIRLDARPPYSKGRRAALKVAQRTGLTVQQSDDFQSFMALQSAVLEARYGAEPVHTPDELALLAERFPDDITLQTATLEGRLLAGVVVYESPVVARAQYIAVSEEGRDVHALDEIIDTLLAAYAGSKQWWDFGASTRDSGRYLNESLIRNKESYGARAVVYDQYRLDLGA